MGGWGCHAREKQVSLKIKVTFPFPDQNTVKDNSNNRVRAAAVAATYLHFASLGLPHPNLPPSWGRRPYFPQTYG